MLEFKKWWHFNLRKNCYMPDEYPNCEINLGEFSVKLELRDEKVLAEITDAYKNVNFSLDWYELMMLGARVNEKNITHESEDDSFIVWHTFESPPKEDKAVIIWENETGDGAVILERKSGNYTSLATGEVIDDGDIYRWAKLPIKLKCRKD